MKEKSLKELAKNFGLLDLPTPELDWDDMPIGPELSINPVSVEAELKVLEFYRQQIANTCGVPEEILNLENT